MTEATIEDHLVRRVKELGGEVRKVQWVGRRAAPDRLVMLSQFPGGLWVEVKSPRTIGRFPADARERAQEREHQRMRAFGLRVEVLGTKDQIEELLS